MGTQQLCVTTGFRPGAGAALPPFSYDRPNGKAKRGTGKAFPM